MNVVDFLRKTNLSVAIIIIWTVHSQAKQTDRVPMAFIEKYFFHNFIPNLDRNVCRSYELITRQFTARMYKNHFHLFNSLWNPLPVNEMQQQTYPLSPATCLDFFSFFA